MAMGLLGPSLEDVFMKTLGHLPSSLKLTLWFDIAIENRPTGELSNKDGMIMLVYQREIIT